MNNEKDRQIKELRAQLEEKDKLINDLRKERGELSGKLTRATTLNKEIEHFIYGAKKRLDEGVKLMSKGGSAEAFFDPYNESRYTINR
jgi:chromosome segregation ATPase